MNLHLKIRFKDELYEWCPGPVQIHEAALQLGIVEGLAAVLLQLDLLYP